MMIFHSYVKLPEGKPLGDCFFQPTTFFPREQHLSKPASVVMSQSETVSCPFENIGPNNGYVQYKVRPR